MSNRKRTWVHIGGSYAIGYDHEVHAEQYECDGAKHHLSSNGRKQRAFVGACDCAGRYERMVESARQGYMIDAPERQAT